MARAETKTYLALDRFAAILGIHPLHFNQVYLAGVSGQPDNSTVRTCDVPIVQHQWQASGRLGREDIAQAIAQAENLIIPRLGYLPVPGWTVEEQAVMTRPNDPGLFNMVSLDVRSYFNSVRAPHGFIISGGQKGLTLIDADAAIVYSDPDGDGYKELATVTAATTVTDTNEIAVFYPGHSGEDAWEIRPLRSVSISGGTVTITFRREQAIAETAMEGYWPSGLDGTSDGNFLTTVDVYRKYNDPSVQSQFIWDVTGGTRCDCDGLNSCETCGYSVQNGCLVVRNPRLGIVSPQPGTWDADTDTFTATVFNPARMPDRVNLWYYSGYRDKTLTRPNVTMSPDLERAITFLAASMLQRPLCNCEPLSNELQRWRDDLALSESTPVRTSSFRLSSGQLNNPFGTTRGAIYAWEIVSNRMLGQGVTP